MAQTDTNRPARAGDRVALACMMPTTESIHVQPMLGLARVAGDGNRADKR
jgi:hypothetical protein